MSLEQIVSAVWRHRALFGAVLAAGMVAVTAVTLLQPPSYTATSTIFFGLDPAQARGVNTDVGEQLTRTHSTLAANPNIADAVRKRTGSPRSRDEVLDRMSFVPVERTQLLELRARADSAGEAQTLANAWATVLVGRVNARFRSGESPARAFVAEPAARPSKSSRPNPALYLGLGFLLSVLLAVLAVLLWERLDQRIRVEPDQDTLLGAPVLGRVPAGGDENAARDAFGILKTNVDFALRERPTSIAVTSAGELEGKGTVASGLALAALHGGEKVVLVEADIRRPGLSHTLIAEGLPQSGGGLTSYLAGDTDLDGAIVEHPELANLSVIRAGPTAPNPAALLHANRIAELVGRLSERYDRVIFDTPPIAVAADASVIAARVDSVVFVVDVTRTKRSQAASGLAQLRNSRALLLGVVLNRAPIAVPGYHREPAAPVT